MFKEKIATVAKLLRNMLINIMLFLLMGMFTLGALATGLMMMCYQRFTPKTAHKDETVLDVKADAVWFDGVE